MPRRAILLVCLFVALIAAAGGAIATPPQLELVLASMAGSLPKGVSISRDGSRLYVTNFGNQNRDNVVVYDADTLRRVDRLDVPGIVVESVCSPDGRTLYVSNFERGSVQFIDLATRRVVREVRTGPRPKVLVLSDDGTRLFAANWSGASVTEIDPNRGSVVRTLYAGRNPRGMALTRAGRLYVANFNGHTIDVYDGPDMEQHHRISPVCHIPRHLALSPDDATLYISCFSASELLAMNTATEQFDHHVPVGHWPKSVDVVAGGRFVVTADYGGSSVSIVDTADWTVSTVDIASMDHASGIVAARAGLRFFVTGWYDGHIFAMDAAGAMPPLAISRSVAAVTLQRRLYHEQHPTE